MTFDRYILFSGYIEEIYKTVQKIKAEHMSSFGLKSTDTTFLAMLSKHEEGLTATELATKCKVDKAVVSRSLRALYDAGAITYAASGKKNYRSLVILTEYGKDIAESMNKIADAVVRAANIGITPEDMDSFYKTLDKLDENLKQYAKNLEC